MTEESISNAAQLFDGILNGRVPRQVRLFAAQGLLPVSREDLLRLQVILSADPDKELAAAAGSSIKGESEIVLIDWITDGNIDPLVLDLLIRVREEEAVWVAVSVHDNVSDETLRVLARHGSPLIQDIIITNQVRIMSCLEILEDLRANTRIATVVLRRVREFEAEFIEKAAAQDQQLEEVEEGVSIEDALSSLRSIGAHIPLEAEMPYGSYEDAGVEAEVENQGVGVFGRLSTMSIKEKILCALKGSREERSILINSRNRLVVNSVLASPKLSDSEVERFAQSRSVSDEVIRIIADNGRWLRLYAVVLALVQNPKIPLQQALRLLPQINNRDMIKVSRNRNAHPVIRKRAGHFVQQRR